MVENGVGLADLGRLRDADGQVALGDGDRGDAHVLAHDDHAGLLVDDHAGELVDLDPKLFDVGEQGHGVALVALRAPSSRTVPGSVERAAGTFRKWVLILASAMRWAVVRSGLRRLIWTVLSSTMSKAISRSTMAPLGIRPLVGTPLVTLPPFALGAEAGDGERALGDGVDLAVGGQQRGHQQGAAEQAVGIAQRRDRDVDAGSRGARRPAGWRSP